MHKHSFSRTNEITKLYKKVNKMLYQVDVEAIGYTAHLSHCEVELEADKIEKINKEIIAEKDGIKLVAGYITPDDQQDPFDAKVFAVLKFAIEANSEDEANDKGANMDFEELCTIAEMIPMPVKDIGNLQPLELERNSWEVTDITIIEPEIPILPVRPQKRMR